MSRFEKQIILQGFGAESQAKLTYAKVLIVGAGGLGCPVVQYLAAAGLGTIGVVDGDVVTLSNLNRQTLYGINDVSLPKVNVIQDWVQNHYNDVEVVCVNEYLTPSNALQLISMFDVVVDCTDNYQTRYMVNDACVLLSKPLVFGAIYENEGQVAVFNVHDEQNIRTNYRDLFPVPPSGSAIPNCAETGVLGVLPGTIGMFMASQTIMLVSGYGRTISNAVLVYNLVTHTMNEYKIRNNQAAVDYIPKTLDQFCATDYKQPCTIRVDNVCTWEDVFDATRGDQDHMLIVDIRDSHELPKLNAINHVCIPTKTLLADMSVLDGKSTVYLFCQLGSRSTSAVAECRRVRPDITFVSVAGGIASLYSHSREILSETKRS